jgi:putative transposase
MKYIDLNRVRAGAVTHPSEWLGCGYDELAGTRKRCRLLGLDCVLRWQGRKDRETFSQKYQSAIQNSIRRRELDRQAHWTESIAVGSEEFTKRTAERVRYRVRLERREITLGIWTVREAKVPYSTVSRNPSRLD